ncbi:OprD family outer membrane porin [Parendozoicomonas sp. Alg238-R29]|uniref:OprD family outer membrane porin n=1 Tax=Parendozoicomonas sp. Alg238-R29 TaxID=2993446 RepID=UPI00248D8F2A|nr:OprD family outer membrane porin [Parendozoicomonas sp. Alg238-R29]
MNLRSLIIPSLATLAAPTIADTIGGIKDDRRPDISFLEEQMSDFMNSNNLEARVRLAEFHRENKKSLNSFGVKEKRKDEGATALGVQINFQSGWYADAVGFDASLFTVGNLNSPYDRTRDLLLVTGSGNKTGFSKLAQAYVKAKYSLEDGQDPLISFRGGRERIYTGLIAGSGSRAIPSAWQGIDVKGGYGGLSYGFAWVDQISLRSSSNFEDLKSFKKKGTPEGKNLDGTNATTDTSQAEKIDYAWGIELDYDIMGLSLKYRDSHAKDFLYTYNLDASYKFDISPGLALTFNAKYYKEKEDGELWTSYVWGSPAFNNDADLTHFNVTADIGNLMLIAGYSKTKASYKDSSGNKRLGVYYYDFGPNTHGGFDIPTSMLIGDFLYDDEKAWIVGAGYNFKDIVPGLTAEVFYTKGDNFKDGRHSENLEEYETDLDIKYKFQTPALDGLSFRFRYGIYRPDGRKANSANNGLGADFSRGRDDYRIYLDYRAKVF